MPKYKSLEANFLNELIESELPKIGKIKNPIINVLVGQLSKLIGLVDMNEEYQQRVHSILDKIKEEWNVTVDTNHST